MFQVGYSSLAAKTKTICLCWWKYLWCLIFVGFINIKVCSQLDLGADLRIMILLQRECCETEIWLGGSCFFQQGDILTVCQSVVAQTLDHSFPTSLSHLDDKSSIRLSTAIKLSCRGWQIVTFIWQKSLIGGCLTMKGSFLLSWRFIYNWYKKLHKRCSCSCIVLSFTHLGRSKITLVCLTLFNLIGVLMCPMMAVMCNSAWS